MATETMEQMTRGAIIQPPSLKISITVRELILRRVNRPDTGHGLNHILSSAGVQGALALTVESRFDYNRNIPAHRDGPGFFMISIRLNDLRFSLLVLMLALFLSGCGQKGPLYMEGHEPPSQRAVAKKRRQEQAKQAEEALKAQPSAGPREEMPESDKDNMPALAPSAPN